MLEKTLTRWPVFVDHFTRRVLQQMSDERLRDIGLRREDVE
ncbi:DUF1127 domain-containing protein [Escherichia coli]